MKARLRGCAAVGARIVLVVSALLVAGCTGPVRIAPHVGMSRPLPKADAVSGERLDALALAAERAPGDFSAQYSAGRAHVRATLTGHLQYQERAERYLSRALDIKPGDQRVARTLARFLNLRATVVDLSKARMQRELYNTAFRGLDAKGEVGAPTQEAFHLFAFYLSADALVALERGRKAEALRRVRRLERAMIERIDRSPDDIDTLAMAGNFELTFAGALGPGQKRRLALGIRYLETQQERWDEMTPAARNDSFAPNVRSVFAFVLAEAQLADGRAERAAATYRSIIGFDVPATRVREQLVAVARHRLANLEAYAGERGLVPVWPNGPSACVACHARQTELPAAGLFILSETAPWEPRLP